MTFKIKATYKASAMLDSETFTVEAPSSDAAFKIVRDKLASAGTDLSGYPLYPWEELELVYG